MMASTEVQVKNNSECKQFFQLQWSDLSYSYSRERGKKTASEDGQRVALHPCDGTMKSSTVTAILGPSGAGKSTLLNCITGRIKPDSGRCFIRARAHLIEDLKRSRIDYVPQNNEFLTLFTVKETLLFASRMTNVGLSVQQHHENIEILLQALDMSEKMDWPLYKLSGGQMKRVAIACGLITRPAVIVLDEPTSGLDSDNAERLVIYLKQLAAGSYLGLKPAVLLTIHSPSVSVFEMFDQVYIMSRGGHNIYQGPPDQAVAHFRSFGFTNMRGNPADWCIDVANGKFGDDKFISMAQIIRSYPDSVEDGNSDFDITTMKTSSVSTVLQIWLLVCRSLTYYSMKLPLLEVRIILNVACLVMFFLMQRKQIIGDPICSNSVSHKQDRLSGEPSVATMKISAYHMNTIADSITLFGFGSCFIGATGFIAINISMFMMKLHRDIHLRELKSSWYSKKSFFWARIITDLIFRKLSVATCTVVLVLYTFQTVELWRMVMVSLILLLFLSTWENIGSIVGILGHRKSLLHLVGFLVLFNVIDDCLMLSSGSSLNWFSLSAKRAAFKSNTFGAIIISLFGLHRCKQQSNQLVDSVSLTQYDGPTDAITDLWRRFNLTRDKTVDLLDLYDVDEDVASGMHHSLSVLASKHRDRSHKHLNYVLRSFGYDDTDILGQTLVLFVWLLVFSVVLAYAIKRKFN